MQTTFTEKLPTSGLSVLAIDTAFDICSVALLTPALTDYCVSETIRKHADDVLPMIHELLSRHQLKIPALDLLAMISGPGSFTGLRIGTAVVQGLAFGADLPVVCVSSLAMLSRAARHQSVINRICLSCLHAREDEFYFAAYTDDLEQAPVALVEDTIMTPAQIDQTIHNISSDSQPGSALTLVAAGSGWQHERLTAIVTRHSLKSVTVASDALLLAELALQHYRAGRFVDAAGAAPVYLKDEMEYRTV